MFFYLLSLISELYERMGSYIVRLLLVLDNTNSKSRFEQEVYVSSQREA